MKTNIKTVMFSAAVPIVRETEGVSLMTSAQVYEQCKDVGDWPQEAFIVLDLSTKNKIIERRLVTLGLADSCLVHPREVFRGAIANGASSIILVHNHPSGDTSPSSEDLRVTRQLILAGGINGIAVLDHIIIGRPNAERLPYMSQRDENAVDFNKTSWE